MNTKGIVLPLILFAFATWIVYLVGLAGVQSNCFEGPGLAGLEGGDPAQTTTGESGAQSPTGAGTQSLTGNTANLLDVFSFSANKLACDSIFRFHWFFLAFTFVTLLGLLICTVSKHPMGSAMHYTRPFWVGMLAISTLLMMLASEGFLTAVVTGYILNWYRTAAAGAIMLVASLIFLMFAVGTHFDYDQVQGKQEYYGGRANVTEPAGVTGAERV